MGMMKRKIEDLAEKLAMDGVENEFQVALEILLEQENRERIAMCRSQGIPVAFCHECETEAPIMMHNNEPHCKYCGHEV